MSAKENVRVVIRAKPLDEAVTDGAAESISSAFRLDTDKGTIIRHGATVNGSNELRHDFDAVFDDGAGDLSTLSAPAKQNVFFEQHVRPLVDRAITQGLNLTVLAYGETSSGKTWTMDGQHHLKDVVAATSCDPAQSPVHLDRDENEETVEGIVSLSMRRCVSVLEPAAASSSSADGNSSSRDQQSAAAAAAASSKNANGGNSGGDVVWMRLAVKFVEIYNEKLVDLLAAAVAPRRNDDNNSERLLRLRLRRREDGEDVFFVENLLCFECDTVADALQWYRRGAQQKTFRAHKMNAHSSRSHCIFTMVVTVCTRGDDGLSLNRRSFEMNFVDLAGSERPDRIAVDDSNVNARQRAKASQQAHALFSESLHINGSLSTLGRVITSLSKGSAHAPYRESKLTSLLRHTLGSNGLMLFVACVSVNNVPETVRTLVFASQARTIRVVARPVMDANTVLIQQLRARIRELELDLSAAVAMNQSASEQQQQQQQQQQQTQQAQNLNLVSHSVLEEVSDANENSMNNNNNNNQPSSSSSSSTTTTTNREALLSQSLFTACTKMQQLIRSNAGLRSQMDALRSEQGTVSERLSELERENLNLREKLDIMSSVVTLEARSTQEALLRAAVHGNYSLASPSASSSSYAAGAAFASFSVYDHKQSGASKKTPRSSSNKKAKNSGSSSSKPTLVSAPYDNRYVAAHPLLVPAVNANSSSNYNNSNSNGNNVVRSARVIVTPSSSSDGGGGGGSGVATRSSSAGMRGRQQQEQREIVQKQSLTPGAQQKAPQQPSAPTAFTVTTRSAQQQQQQQQLPPLASSSSSLSIARSPSAAAAAPRFPPYMISSAQQFALKHGGAQQQQPSQQQQLKTSSQVVGLPLSLYGGGTM